MERSDQTRERKIPPCRVHVGDHHACLLSGHASLCRSRARSLDFDQRQRILIDSNLVTRGMWKQGPAPFQGRLGLRYTRRGSSRATLPGCENSDLVDRRRRRQPKPAASPRVDPLDVDTDVAFRSRQCRCMQSLAQLATVFMYTWSIRAR
jgi:hypothetical protein